MRKHVIVILGLIGAGAIIYGAVRYVPSSSGPATAPASEPTSATPPAAIQELIRTETQAAYAERDAALYRKIEADFAEHVRVAENYKAPPKVPLSDEELLRIVEQDIAAAEARAEAAAPPTGGFPFAAPPAPAESTTDASD